MLNDLDTDRRPAVLAWEVTQACGLACRHCRANARPERHPDELTTAEGKRLLESAAEFGDGQVVVLSGGDPLTRDDLTELITYGDDLGLRMAVTPSGTASLTPDRVHELADAGVARMALSLDGSTRERHDAFRGEASFADTLAAPERRERPGSRFRSTPPSVPTPSTTSPRSGAASASSTRCSGAPFSSCRSAAAASSTPSRQSAPRP